MSNWGRLRLLALAGLLAAVLSLEWQGQTAARVAGLEPPPPFLAAQPDVQEIIRAAQAEAERLQESYSLYVHGVETGYAFELNGHLYLPARRLFESLGGSVRALSGNYLEVDLPGLPIVTVPMYSQMDRGYVRLEQVRQLLPSPVHIDRKAARVETGVNPPLPPMPPSSGGLQAVWLDDQIFSTRALQVSDQVYVPLATSAQYLAVPSQYDTVSHQGFLDGKPIATFFSPLSAVAGVPYVRLNELLDRINLQAAVRLTPAGWADRLSSAGPGLTLAAVATAPPPSGSVVYGGDGGSKRIALTFDDYLGPWIPNLLTVLRQLEVRATFFAIGSSVKAHPELARMVITAGHQLASHTYNHYNMFTMTMPEVRAEIAGTRRAIKQATGVDSVYWRPPGGYINSAIIEQAALPLGMTTVLWSVNSNDANQRLPAADVYGAVMRKAFPGAIVAMHMGSAATAEALPRIVADLRAQGYRFVSVEELLQPEAR